MDKSKIEWTDRTANWWWGCDEVSPGCAHCYARTLAERWFPEERLWGPPAVSTRQRKKGVWNQVPKWNREFWRECPACGYRGPKWAQADRPVCVDCDSERGQLVTLNPSRQRVFTQSMSDLFEDHPLLEPMRRSALRHMELATNIDWQVLTKRPENVARMVPRAWLEKWPAHIWLGTSVEDPKRAWERVPEILKIPAPVIFLSIEPLLAPVSLVDFVVPELDFPGGIKWAIVGGESGAKARPMKPEWVRKLRDECALLSIPFFFKQWGEYGPDNTRMGKAKAGRVLDGKTHSEFPRTPFELVGEPS